MSIYNLENKKPKRKSINDDKIMQNLEQVIRNCQDKLHGEFDPYCFYQNEEKEIYALVYAFYLEKEGVSYGDMCDISEYDAKYLHTEMKRANVKLDYLYIVPYYDYEDVEMGSIMTGAVITKDFNIY